MNNKSPFTIGVIISTYNNPAWLEKVLWGYTCQTRLADEIIIADDGSTEETSLLLKKFGRKLPLKHVWHEDLGFQKTKILNAAIKQSTSDYLIFTDQDLIPRNDFVDVHYQQAQKGYFLSGGAILLPQVLSNKINAENIRTGTIFSIKWLCRNGMPLNWKLSKLVKSKIWTFLLNNITTAKATWNGGNSSTWRDLLLTANGFDERMKYGGEDREFGERLFNMGIKSKQLRYSLPLLHLYHTRPYKNEKDIISNKKIRTITKKNKIIRTPYGIEQE